LEAQANQEQFSTTRKTWKINLIVTAYIVEEQRLLSNNHSFPKYRIHTYKNYKHWTSK
jgi:hypothetical protein